MNRWYVAQTHLHSEDKAAFHLRNQSFVTYLPKYKKIVRHARKEREVLRPLFPRYLFVKLDVDADRWRLVYSTVGIANLIGGGINQNGISMPTAVPDLVMEAIKLRETELGVISLDGPVYEKNQVVRIQKGPLIDHVGLFDEMADESRAFLLVEIMGRDVRIKASVSDIVCA